MSANFNENLLVGYKTDLPPRYLYRRKLSQSRKSCTRISQLHFSENLLKVSQSQQQRWLKSRGKAFDREFSSKDRGRLRTFFDELDISKTGSITLEQLCVPLISLGLAGSEDDVAKLFASSKFSPSTRLPFEGLIQLILKARDRTGKAVLFDFFKKFMNSRHNPEELPLNVFLSNRRRKLLFEALTSESEADRQRGLKLLASCSSDVTIPTTEQSRLQTAARPSRRDSFVSLNRSKSVHEAPKGWKVVGR